MLKKKLFKNNTVVETIPLGGGFKGRPPCLLHQREFRKGCRGNILCSPLPVRVLRKILNNSS